VKKIIKDLEHVSSQSVVSTSTVGSRNSGHGKKVGILRSCVTERM
jgi:hypothetical protein